MCLNKQFSNIYRPKELKFVTRKDSWSRKNYIRSKLKTMGGGGGVDC